MSVHINLTDAKTIAHDCTISSQIFMYFFLLSSFKNLWGQTVTAFETRGSWLHFSYISATLSNKIIARYAKFWQ